MSQSLEDILKAKLYQAEMELPEGDWDEIAQKMSSEKRKKRLPIVWWTAAAVFVGLLISVGVVTFNHQTNTLTADSETNADQIEEPNSMQTIPTVLNKETAVVIEDKAIISTHKKMACVLNPQTAQTKSFSEDNISQKTSSVTDVSAIDNISQKTLDVQNAEPIVNQENQSLTEEVSPSTKEKISSETEETDKKQISAEEAEQIMKEIDKSFEETTLKAEKSYTAWSLGVASSSALLNNIQGKTVAVANPIGGGPIGVTRTQRTAHYDMPVTVGLSVGVALIPRLDILTGINYTYLSSKFSDITSGNDGSIEEKQQCHYLGIPLMLSYRFVDRKIVKCYTSIGGMGEKGIVRNNEIFTYDTESNLIETTRSQTSIDGMQWSLTANVGVALTLYKGLNIYFEPGFTWYIPNSKNPQPETMRTKNPYNLSLALGLRFNFEKNKK